jgi:hypothetical protein
MPDLVYILRLIEESAEVSCIFRLGGFLLDV